MKERLSDKVLVEKNVQDLLNIMDSDIWANLASELGLDYSKFSDSELTEYRLRIMTKILEGLVRKVEVINERY